ncbi:DUF192 domain-containing protein [Candidatus Nanohalobium constans]|uniref:DUF192 domain-containing protein n=1 Tax=Candidatus Nanohalobium constans TaxID=2565781 RepID=A0A5Q0UGY1_9ARCH|nr:DUF192 domain-containing protein [Candidatus Nanohalobium constans]QGA80229.1 hypothetical protein LC1Nh_0328 [Candidatus Nanohalobium constans]
MKDFNPFKILPLILTAQIAVAFVLGGGTQVHFPDSSTSLDVEIADTPQEREKGLMYREKLPIEQGMLFVFPEEDDRGFWMKNTLIPLDIIFVDSEGKIINIEEAVPEPNTSDENLKTYRSDAPAKYVIETNSSFVERENVEEGDRVVIPDRFN